MSIRTTKMQKIRRRIRDSIRVAKRRGYSIVPNETLDQAKACCCPLAAVYVAINRLTPKTQVDDQVDPITEVRRTFRLKDQDVSKFIVGFDEGADPYSEEPRSQYEAFGQELRMEYDFGLL
jgi:hypothetical protein